MEAATSGHTSAITWSPARKASVSAVTEPTVFLSIAPILAFQRANTTHIRRAEHNPTHQGPYLSLKAVWPRIFAELRPTCRPGPASRVHREHGVAATPRSRKTWARSRASS